ncbi:HK97 gp10 family phage protein [Streptomyces sp. NBC_00878]|uniref:HK97 gp10 family phage protein n=1 Tax=Streptomyces sp. NBC_00878 TaxID=2975854 RepID=UPI00224C8708|nr:HK97 gp10 family phage protein [Streptomyces sp. NBC_00878]MCX4911803.1 HK97 gp10 family phage protein [Streptomyces sp. NBC_00878]
MDLDQFAERLNTAADRVGPEVDRTVQQQGRLLRALIMERASGRPGPNVISGDYRGSWQPEPFPVPDGGGVTIGTRAPQGRRLEYGYMNMYDSLGRFFRQPPFPHVEPSVNELEEIIIDPFKAACDRIFGS